MSGGSPDVSSDHPEPAERMSVVEARQVPWLRSRPKPLGELLDEGYLNTARLEWAAKWAYNARLKEAARVLLECQGRQGPVADQPPQGRVASAEAPQKLVPIGIGLEEARATPWPFGPLKGQPMGALSETEQLSLKDLAYAIENAWDERVQRAAIALMLTRLYQELEKPPSQAGNLRVVADRRTFAQRRQLSLAMLEGAIGGSVLTFAVVNLAVWLPRQHTGNTSRITMAEVVNSPQLTALVVATLLVLASGILLAFFGLDRLIAKLDRKIEAYRQGEEGEERVIEKARRALDGQWTLFRNVMLPGRRGDLDIVLVGPPGVWALEVKALRGQYRNQGEAWEQWRGSRWRRMGKSPSIQARREAAALAEFLEADRIKTYVHAAIAWADEDCRVSVEDPSVAVWTMDRIEDELGNLWNGHRLGEAERERIVDNLTRLCQARRKGPW